MGNVQYLSDGHHVDEAGNLICCTYADLRPAVGRLPVGALKTASSKLPAVPDCETIRISKPSCLHAPGEGLTASAGGDAREVESSGNVWVYPAFIEPETPEQQAVWRAAMPAGCDAVSPIHRPREFARALGAMVAEQVGPQGRTVLLRSAVGDQAFRTAHRVQTVYHGPVVYTDDPDRRLESASSVLELALLRVFMKPAANRGQREYLFAVWADGDPARDWVDLEVSAALLDAMQRPPQEPECGVVVPACVDDPAAVEEVDQPGPAGGRVLVEAPLAVCHPTIVPLRYGAEGLPAETREAATVDAAVEALRAAVDQLERGRDAAAAAWHAEPVVRRFCSTYGGVVAGVRVNEDSFIVVTATVPGDQVVEVMIAVGPDGVCACKVNAAGGHGASAAPDVRAFEQVLASRLAEAGVRGRSTPSRTPTPSPASSTSSSAGRRSRAGSRRASA